uniref:QWRF motif-containing protein 3 n=1 Tax=Brassica oleracea var. oleracea TaxID=109376 RepID=A0A0D3D256_BRAOL
MKSCEHENVSLKTTSRGKSRVVSSRFLSPSSCSSPIGRNSTSNSSSNNVHLGLRKNDRMSDGIPNQSNGPEVDTKENSRQIDDEDNVILPGKFSVDECALHRSSSLSSSRRNSRSSLLYYNDESDSELSDVSFASTTLSTSRSLSRSHKPGIKVSSKYLHDARKGCTTNNIRLQQGSQSFRGIESRTNSAARYGSSMSQWALSPGRSLEAHQASSIYPSSNLKPPRGKGVGKLFNLGLDFFRRSKNKSSPISSPLKPKTEASHQLKLMNNRLVQWRFVNARASAANNNVASRAKKQLLCACDALTKLQNLVLQERINLQKKQLEMKLAHLLVSQVKHLEAWEDMGREHFSSISMTTQSLHSLLSRVPLREGAKVKIESAVTIFRKGEAVSDAIISTVNSFAPKTRHGLIHKDRTEPASTDTVWNMHPFVHWYLLVLVPLDVCNPWTSGLLGHLADNERLALVEHLAVKWRLIEDIVPLASQLAEVVAQEKLMLEQCHDLLRMISEFEMQERSLKCCLMIQHKKTLYTKLVQD